MPRSAWLNQTASFVMGWTATAWRLCTSRNHRRPSTRNRHPSPRTPARRPTCPRTRMPPARIYQAAGCRRAGSGCTAVPCSRISDASRIERGKDPPRVGNRGLAPFRRRDQGEEEASRSLGTDGTARCAADLDSVAGDPVRCRPCRSPSFGENSPRCSPAGSLQSLDDRRKASAESTWKPHGTARPHIEAGPDSTLKSFESGIHPATPQRGRGPSESNLQACTDEGGAV